MVAMGGAKFYLITKQDVLNIKRRLNIGSVQKHNNDHSSVCAWVQELQNMAYNSILHFKPLGCTCSMGKFKNGDFLLGIQTEFQQIC